MIVNAKFRNVGESYSFGKNVVNVIHEWIVEEQVAREIRENDSITVRNVECNNRLSVLITHLGAEKIYLCPKF